MVDGRRPASRDRPGVVAGGHPDSLGDSWRRHRGLAVQPGCGRKLRSGLGPPLAVVAATHTGGLLRSGPSPEAFLVIWRVFDVHSRCRLWGHGGAYSREEETWGTSVGVAVNSSVAPARRPGASSWASRSEEHTSELQSHVNLVCRL